MQTILTTILHCIPLLLCGFLLGFAACAIITNRRLTKRYSNHSNPLRK